MGIIASVMEFEVAFKKVRGSGVVGLLDGGIHNRDKLDWIRFCGDIWSGTGSGLFAM